VLGSIERFICLQLLIVFRRTQTDCTCLFQSNNDEELSEAELPDEDSEDALSRLPVEDVGDPEVLAKLKQQVCAHNHHAGSGHLISFSVHV